jgi:hypothetical protein
VIPARLLRVFVEEFRSIYHQWLPVEGLVVLFGPNSAGKTSVLEAAVELLRAASSSRVDPGVSADVLASGSVTFALPGAGIAGTLDNQLFQEWEGVAPEIGVFMADEAPAATRERIGSTPSGGLPDAPADHEILARGIAGILRGLDPASTTWEWAQSDEVFVQVDVARIPRAVRQAAERIAADADLTDPLWNVAICLREAKIPLGADGGALGAASPPVIVLDVDLDSLSAQLHEAVSVIHDRLWGDPDSGPGAFSLHSHDFTIGPALAGGRFTDDRWLERLSDTGEPTLPGLFGYGRSSDWYRVRRSVLAVAALIAEEANRVAPGFLAEQGQIAIETLPVSVWGRGNRRLRVTFTGLDGESRDLGVIGAGTARWAASAVRLACWRLQQGHRVVTDRAGSVITDPDAAREAIRTAIEEPLTQAAVRLESADAPVVYVVDEPEAHLHPAAVISVRSWLEELTRTDTAAVLTATHSPIFLSTCSPRASRILVLPGSGLHAIEGAQDEYLAQAAGQLGITRGDLLLMTRRGVFVEGDHEMIILGEWFGDELRAAGIRLFPAHGSDNFEEVAATKPGLVGAEIIGALGIQMAVIIDASAARAERTLNRIRRQADHQCIKVPGICLSERDILFYLDDQICKEAAPAFPGWHDAYAAFEQRRDRKNKKWKQWVSDTYHLDLTCDGIRMLAIQCKRQGCVPQELKQRIQELTLLC